MAGSWVHNDFPEVEKLVKEFRDKIWKLENKTEQGSPVGQFECKIETDTFDGGDRDDLFTKKSLISRKLIITINLFGHDDDDDD